MDLRRHRLALLSDVAWQALRAQPRDAQAQDCIDYWSAHRLPLVVTRQRAGSDALSLGLPAPAIFGRRRWLLEVPPGGVVRFDEFPAAATIAPMLARSVRPRWLALCAALAQAGCAARVYGSHGWQSMTGLRYLHAESDIDLALPAADAAAADAVCAAMIESDLAQPRLDGELIFADGAAVAWREWLQWRGGNTRQMLVKRLHGVALEAGPLGTDASIR